MYQSATITIDPRGVSQLRRKPTKGFRRFAELLSCNLLSTKEEHETFTALSILQEMNIVLRSIGVTDVVKFSRDGQVLYEDVESTSKDDMSLAIKSVNSPGSGGVPVFNQLSLLLEHHLATLALIIEIKVFRVHDVGVYPIQVSVNGLDAQMQSGDLGSLNAQLDSVFASQQSYDSYAEAKKTEFAEFVDQLESAFRSRMQIDNLHRRVYTNVVRPGLTPSSNERSASDATASKAGSAPMLSRYDNTSDSLMYLWMWSSFMHSNNIYCHDTTIVNETGTPAFSVGDSGFNAGETSTLDPEAPFEAPDCPIEPATGVDGEVASQSDFDLLSYGGDESRSGWLDSFSFGGHGDGGTDVGSDVGGGDAGGASCGGGCGGGGCGGGCGS